MPTELTADLVGVPLRDRRLVEALRSRSPAATPDGRSYRRTVNDVEIAVKASRHLSGLQGVAKSHPKFTIDDLDRLGVMSCGNKRYNANLLPKKLRSNGLSRPDRGWVGKSELKVAIDLSVHFPSVFGFSQSDFTDAILGAMSIWNNWAIGIQFVAADGLPADVLVRWSPQTSDPHGVLQQGYIAHGDFPKPNWEHVTSTPIPICFSMDKMWSVENTTVVYDVQTVAIHELGHCLGLQHRTNGTVMYEQVTPGVRRFVDLDSATAARSLY